MPLTTMEQKQERATDRLLSSVWQANRDNNEGTLVFLGYSIMAQQAARLCYISVLQMFSVVCCCPPQCIWRWQLHTNPDHRVYTQF